MDAWRIEVATAPGLEDAATTDLRARLGLGEGAPALALRGFLLPANLGEELVNRAATELCADPIADRFVVQAPGSEGCFPGFEGCRRLSVRRLPGVMDPVARSLAEALAGLGIEVTETGTYRSFLLPARTGDAEIEGLARFLANEVIEEVCVDRSPSSLPKLGARCDESRVEIELATLGEAELCALSRERWLSLDGAEMLAIQRHFAELGRAPTLCELETLAQTWSEHCKHKTLAGRIEVEGGKSYDNLLAETIFRVTEEIDHPFCLSVFVDNAGVIAFDQGQALCIKVETHNHPSAIEPFGGAGTGVGGVIRDILGTGLGARPLCNLDVFCVGPPDLPLERCPAGSLHPARVLDGIVRGVRDYGNPMGIPTVAGAVHFDEGFVGNPLVYCGTVGILPCDKVEKRARPGDRVVVAGGRTGRDGIHGATFSSVELSEESETVSSGAVQIGDPITEKKVCDALLMARDEGLFTAVTDCGAGGLSSAVGEMGEHCGASVELCEVPLKYAGLSPTEIWISEAQERMVFAVPPDKLARFREICARFGVEHADLGSFTDSGRLEIAHEGENIAALDMAFLHDGLPKQLRKARYVAPELEEPELDEPSDYGAELCCALGNLNVASREWILRQYDHEVQGMSAAKPYSGTRQEGPGDAAVLRPLADSRMGFALGCGLTPRYSRVDPAAMAEAALDEALRNVVCRGGDPTRCAVLDNYCWGNTDDPAQLGGLVRATEALAELALHYRTPFVSGKDSLNNEYRAGDETLSIPGSLLVTALAIVPDVELVPDSALRGPDHSVYLCGTTLRELGGSVYLAQHGALGAHAPRARALESVVTYRALADLVQFGGILAMHDLAEGGLGVAAAEMAFGGGYGLFLDLANVVTSALDATGDGVEEDLRADEILFSESLGRILVEVDPEAEERFVTSLGRMGVPHLKVGETSEAQVLVADGPAGDRLLELPLALCREAWRAPLAKGPLAHMPGARR